MPIIESIIDESVDESVGGRILKMAESKPVSSDSDSSQSDRLPFEPGKGRKRKEAKATEVKKVPPRSKQSQSSRPSRSTKTLDETRIPDVVSKRMLRRMAFFSGLPGALGVSTFFVAYYLLTNEILEFPNSFVLAVSLLFFGLSVLGLSYGVLSASWEEQVDGSLLGTQEFKLNFGRMRGAWREAKQAKKP